MSEEQTANDQETETVQIEEKEHDTVKLTIDDMNGEGEVIVAFSTKLVIPDQITGVLSTNETRILKSSENSVCKD